MVPAGVAAQATGPQIPRAVTSGGLPAIFAGFPASPARETHEPGQVAVYWPRFEDADAVLTVLARDVRRVPVERNELASLGGVLAVFQLDSAAEARDFRDRLQRDFPGTAVDLNTHYRPSAQPRIYLPQKMDAPPRQDRPVQAGLDGSVRIGLVDTGVAPIMALSGVTIVRKSFMEVAEKPAPQAHGTAVASLIAGNDVLAGFYAIAPDSALYSAEIMRREGQEGVTSSAKLVRALDWLLASKVQVINLSLGGPGDAVMARVFQRLETLAVVTVAAAGNGGPEAPAAYPAAYPGVIAVTATDASDNVWSGANRGDYIVLAAPGVDLWVPDSATGHYVSGTSFSAAAVSAASALLLARFPQLNSRDMAARLCRTAHDLGVPGRDARSGCGLVQVQAALRDARP